MDVVYAIKRLALLRAFTRDFAPLQDSSGFLGLDGDGFRAGFENTPHGDLARGLAADCGRAVLSLRPWMRPDIAQAIESMQATPETAWLTYIVRMAETTPCHPYPVRMTAEAFVVRPFFRQSDEGLELLQRHLAEMVAERDAQPAASDEPRVVSREAPAETTPAADEPLDRAMLAEAKACHQRAEGEARQAGRDSTAWHEGDVAAKSFQAGSDTDIARALVDARRIPQPSDDKAWEALRKRIGRRRKKLAKKDAGWRTVKPKRGSATGGQIADARGQAGMSLERRSSENDTGVRWCRNCGIQPADSGESFCETCMHRLDADDREGILDGSVRPLSSRLTKDALERERSGALQRIAQAAEERKREASGKASR